MLHAKPLSTLVLKQNRLKNWHRYMWIPIAVAYVLGLGSIIPALSRHLSIDMLIVILPATLLIYLALDSARLLLPGQGDLILTPEGFEVRMPLKQECQKYQWNQVSVFYVKSIQVGKDFRQRLCFDVLKEDEKSEREYLSLDYDLSLNALAALLNEWKKKYEMGEANEDV